jgi:SWIRM-associated domain at the N-terminal/SWIRM domain/SWIRM-associated region 1/Myb-like DNA-binding domain/Zinc finger, ZZ type
MGSSGSPHSRSNTDKGSEVRGNDRSTRGSSSSGRAERDRSSRLAAASAPPPAGETATAPDASPVPAVRAKSAFISLPEYEEPKMMSRFGPICDSMQQKSEDDLGFNSVDVTQRVLSTLTGQLRLFIETVLGRNSEKTRRPITKIPHKLFSDYRPDGALEVILSTCLRFKASSGLRRLDFSSGDKLTLYLDMLRLIEKNLTRAKLLPAVKVFISQMVPAEGHPRLRSLMQGRGAMVSSAQQATHILYPDPEGTTPAETDGTDYCRTLEFAHAHALVHWWYYPDSYDSWIPRSDVQGDPEPDAEHRGPWHVQMRWLHDTDLFNEWMNEADYEISEEARGSGAGIMPGQRKQVLDAGAPEGSSKKSSKKRKRSEVNRAERWRDADLTRDKQEHNELQEDVGHGKLTASAVLGDAGADAVERAREPGQEREKGRELRRERDRHRDRTHRNREKGRERPERSDRRELEEDRHKRESSGGSGGQGTAVDGGRWPRRESIDEDQIEPSETDTRGGGTRADDLTLWSFEDRSQKRSKNSIDDARSNASSADSRPLKVRINVRKDADSEYTKARDPEEDQVEKGSMPSRGLNVRVRISSLGAKTSASELAGGPLNGNSTEAKSSDGVPMDLSEHARPESRTTSPANKVLDAADGTDRGTRRSKSRKRDRRRSVAKNPGVSVVEVADPIPEADVRKIRNISMESMENGSGPDVSNCAGSDVELTGIDPVTSGISITAADANGEDLKSEERRTAVAKSGLGGPLSGAPVSTADLIESLPQCPVRIPAQSRWFSMDAIHELEKRSIPEFFLGRSVSKTPKVYKLYRDFMIDSWRQCPTKYLTATAVRRHLAGDVCSILRVHAFLEHWGLINFGVEPESRPQYASMKGIRSEFWNATPISVQPSHSNLMGSNMDSSIPRLLLFDEALPASKNVQSKSLQSALRSAGMKTKTEVPLATRRDIYAAAAAVVYECDACGADCSRMRYHCVGQADVDLCPICFAEGRYPSTLSTRDFEQLTTVSSSHAYDGSVWSESEVLLLLEGLEKFGDDWNAVASHVRTKTNEQCVLQFLRMPIEDSFLGDQLGKWGRAEGQGAAARAASGERQFASAPLPFADASNPVMAQIAFLASSVSPEVAAAAAQAALTKIMSETDKAAPVLQREIDEKRTDLASVLMNGEASRSIASQQARQPGKDEKTLSAEDADPTRTTPSASAQQPCRLREDTPGEIPTDLGQPRMNGLPSPHDPRSDRQAFGIGSAGLDAAAVQASAAVGLAAAAARARKLADAELREIERAFAVVVETKLRAIEDKMQTFSRMEEHLRAERDRIERQRLKMYADRVSAAHARSGGKHEALAVDFEERSSAVGPIMVQSSPTQFVQNRQAPGLQVIPTPDPNAELLPNSGLESISARDVSPAAGMDETP